jgi:DNA polymerase-4
LRQGDIAAHTVVLKLKTAEFRIVTRRHRLPAPTQLAEVLYRAALPMLTGEADGRRFRLIGVGGIDLTDAGEADPADLLDPEGRRLAQLERVVETVRDRMGPDAIRKGRGLATRPGRGDGRGGPRD